MKKKILISFVSLIILFFLFIAYIFIEPYCLKNRQIEFKSTKVPENFNNIKIIFIADIHHGPYFSYKRVVKLVNRINKLKPDIILLGGDYVHRDIKYIEPVINEFGKFEARYGVYGVIGNHDHWESYELTKKYFQQNNINLIDNKSFWLKIKSDSIKIGGVADLWEAEQLLDSTIFDVSPKDFCILVSHNPDYFENAPKNTKIDIALAGHTHGGQMSFFGLYSPVLPSKYGQKYRYGWVKNNNYKIYVTSGVGVVTPPVRFFCRPEIVVLKLKN